MRRRDFITLIGTAAAVWPIAARAQQSAQLRRIGLLMVLAADDARMKAEPAGLRDGLAQLVIFAGLRRARLARPSKQLFVLMAGGLCRARRIRHRLATRLRRCPAAHPKVRILIFARSHYLRVDLWQRLGGPPPLRRTGHNRSNAIHDDPKAHIGAIGNKTSLCAYLSDLGAGSPLRRRLSGNRLRRRSLSRSGLNRCRLSRSRLSRLGQR